MRRWIRVYGSLFVLASFLVCGFFAVALFVSASWVVETLGLVGFAVFVVWICVCAVLSFTHDLVGNAREAFE